jgi:hypothetical protein
MRRLPLLGLLALLPIASHAATPAPASIHGETTWTAAGSPWRVTEDVTVGPDAYLTLEPGATVELAEGRSITVNGALVARGTEAAPVTFTRAPEVTGDARWGSIVFTDSSVDADVGPGDAWVSGSVLEHAVVEYGARAVRLYAASPLIARSTFRFNRYMPASMTDDEGGAALYVGPDSAPLITGCTFDDNFSGKAAWGGAILADRAAPVVKGNTFRRNTSPYGGALTFKKTASPVVGNTFEDNEAVFEGGAVSLYSSCPAFVGNRLTGNHARLDGGGVHVCIECFPHANPSAFDNVIVGNTSNDNNTLAGSGEPPGAAGFGAAFLRAFVDNEVHDNTVKGVPRDFAWRNHWLDLYPAWVTSTTLTGTWWGTTDDTLIAGMISDASDDPGVGWANQVSPRTEAPPPPPPRVIITPRDIGFGLEGEPMPVYLTLVNPGAAVTVDLLITLSYGEAAVPFLGDVPFAGATRDGDLLRLDLQAGAVLFGTLLAPAWADAQGLTNARWSATIFDATSGARLGQTSEASAELGWTEPLGGAE